MTISRRGFLSGVAPVIAVAAAGSLRASAPAQTGDELREDVFRSLVGTKFTVHEGTRNRGTVSLTEVTSLDAAKNRTRHAFSVRFAGAQLAQGTYTFKQSGREFVLFVVPGKRSANPTATAIINRV